MIWKFGHTQRLITQKRNSLANTVKSIICGNFVTFTKTSPCEKNIYSRKFFALHITHSLSIHNVYTQIDLLIFYWHLTNSGGFAAFFDKLEVEPDITKPNHLIVAISSDKGLCGGVHSAICKAVKAEMALKSAEANVKLVAVGDKARGILARLVYLVAIMGV